MTSDFEDERLVSAGVEEIPLDLNRRLDQIGGEKFECPVAEAEVAALRRVGVDVPGHVSGGNWFVRVF